MKNIRFVFIFILVLVLVACSGNNQTAIAPIQVQDDATAVPTMTRTFTPIPSDTPLPTIKSTASIIPTASIAPTPTVTPENSVHANSGFDIANVQVSNPSSDQVNINFEYSIDPSKKLDSEIIVIGMVIPPACAGMGGWGIQGYGGPSPWDSEGRGGGIELQSPTGHGQLSYKQTTSGKCEIPSFEILITFLQKISVNNFKFREVYREQINQPLKVFKTETTPKLSKMVTLKNFSFEATGAWAGNLTFDYVVLPEYFDTVRGHTFRVGGAGDILYCLLDEEGPSITEAAGTYTIPIDMKHYHSNYNWAVRCHAKLAENSRLVINQISLSLFENDFHYVEFGIVLKKQP